MCGGAGTRLWPQSKKNIPKQFIDFGNWTLFEKTLKRIKISIFDYPIISTNFKYLHLVKKYLLKNRVKNFKIVLEPYKKNTASAILSSTLLKEVHYNQPVVFFSADHLFEKHDKFNREIFVNKKNLKDNNIFIFGIKPTLPSSEYGYFLTKKISNNLQKVNFFYEKPNINKAKKIIKRGGYWNSGMFFAKKSSIINNFKKYEPEIYKYCYQSVKRSKISRKICLLDKKSFGKIKEKSFDHAILEKTKDINAIKLDIPWSDLGSWREILKIFYNNKSKYYKKRNVYFRPWGRYTNLFSGKGFLIKELVIKSKSSISLQKHNHRSEHWLIISGRPKITLNKKTLFKNEGEIMYIPKGSIHRIENKHNSNSVIIMEAQVGLILKESDIIRYKDIYGRVN